MSYHADHRCDSQQSQLSWAIESFPPLAAIKKACPPKRLWVRSSLILPPPGAWELFSGFSFSVSFCLSKGVQTFIKEFFYLIWLDLLPDILFSCCKWDSANDVFLSKPCLQKRAINRLQLKKRHFPQNQSASSSQSYVGTEFPSLVIVAFISQIKKDNSENV